MSIKVAFNSSEWRLISGLLVVFYCLVFSLTANAESKTLYKRVDKNGHVTFSGKPLPGSKPINVDTSKNVLAIPLVKRLNETSSSDNKEGDENSEGNTDSTDELFYPVLSIEQPASGEAIKDAKGNLYVIVAMTPHLNNDHSIRLTMDGKVIEQGQKVPYFSLTDIKQGSHQLMAEIIDDSNQQILQASDALSFNMNRNK